MVIGNRIVGPGQPCFVIAEAGVNHNGDVALALRLIDAAAEAGADAVKFQTFSAERLAIAASPKAAYQCQTTAADESQRDMLARLELPPNALQRLQARCSERGIVFLSTPFDEGSADMLEDLDIPAFKIASGEITNWPLLEHIARKRRPVFLSTGMANLAEVADAVAILRDAGAHEIVLLHCTSAYPAPPEAANLRAMETLAEAFDVVLGYSDHTEGIVVPLAAVARGASVVEKHLTLDRDLPGPDHRASLEPGEFGELVRGIRTVEAAFGDGVKQPTADERAMAAVVRRSLVAARNLAAGERLTREMLAAKRPGTGLSPAALPDLLGRRLRVNVGFDEPLTLEMLEPADVGRA